MQAGFFQKVLTDDLSGYNLMSDMLGGYQKQCRKYGEDCFNMKTWSLEVGQGKKRSFSYCLKIQNTAEACSSISGDDSDQNGDNRKKAPNRI